MERPEYTLCQIRTALAGTVVVAHTAVEMSLQGKRQNKVPQALHLMNALLTQGGQSLYTGFADVRISVSLFFFILRASAATGPGR